MENRIALWDNLKFFLVTCVVVGHFADQFTDVSIIYDSIFLFIYSFHIPLFIYLFLFQEFYIKINIRLVKHCFSLVLVLYIKLFHL